MDAESLLHEGNLSECKDQLFGEIRKDPSNINLRIFLFQLACVSCDWERAKNQLNVLKEMSDATLAMVSTYEQLIGCEQKRINVLSGNKEPTCFGEPAQWLAFYTQGYQQYINGHFDQSLTLIEKGADLAPAISGTINNSESFAWLSDGDIRFGPSFEVMLNGNYYRLPFEYIKEINFEPIEDLRDVVWRPANLTLKNNGQLIIFMPMRYPIHANTTDEQLLAKVCDWHEPIANYYVGNGQKVLITDASEYPLMNIDSIQFN
ncbi:type VI secretion system accessory protein TagJ [Colwellia sp. MEBiC06753]